MVSSGTVRRFSFGMSGSRNCEALKIKRRRRYAIFWYQLFNFFVNVPGFCRHTLEMTEPNEMEARERMTLLWMEAEPVVRALFSPPSSVLRMRRMLCKW